MDAFYFLRKLESHGYQAFLVGGFIRDSLLGVKSTDVDITTDATPEQIGEVFNIKVKDKLGSIHFETEKYQIDITTFRKEHSYEKRRPIKVEYIKSLEEDLKRRDFTVNALASNASTQIIDLSGGLDDLKNKLIKSIGTPDKKFKEDPLRMLRAIRFATILDFTIETNTLKAIKTNKNLLKTLSYERKKEELTKILTSKNAQKGINLIKKLALQEILEIDIPTNFKPTNNYLGSWALLHYSEKYPFTKQEKKTIKSIRALLKKDNFTNKDLFEFTFETCLIAGEILGLDKANITKTYNEMPIKHQKELKIQGKEIKEILKVEEGPFINVVKLDLINMILSGKLPNEVTQLTKYLNKKWK